MTIETARKKLGKLGENLTDEEISNEIEISEFLAELIIEVYKKPNNYLIKKTNYELQS